VERTDAGNAAYFAHLYGDELRYDHSRRHWFVWRLHRWEKDSDGKVERLAKQAMTTLYKQAAEISDPDEQKRVAKHAISSRSAQRLKAMIALAQSEHPLSVKGDGWDTDKWLFGVANGVVNLRTGKLRDGRKEDQITLHTNVRFDPNATAPRWRQFLDEVFECDESLIEFVARAVGYSLTGDVSEECLFMLHGTGANGKSKFLGALHEALGAYSHNIPFTSLEALSKPSISNDIASLVGRRFVMASETNETTKLNEGRIKGLTGGDQISARFLYGEYFTFRPVSKFWLAVNHKPKVSDDSYGFWRRVRLIPFERTFDQVTADKNLEQKLKDEAEGVLAWAVRGCLEWQHVGLNPPARVTKATEEYRQENDQISIFVEDQCLLGSMQSVRAQEMYSAFVEWAKDQGVPKQEIMTNAMFGRRMTERFEKKKAKNGAVYHGVKLARRF
jgi:putative DNA primase/helicase